jgi:hypothetical protein
VKVVSDLCYDFCINIITRKHEQAKRVLMNWCQAHGLRNACVRDYSEDCGWSSFSVFSSYIHSQNFLMLESNNTKQAFKELLDDLRKVDDKVRVRSNWQNLEKYMHLENEMTEWKNKVAFTETELSSEESRLSRESEVHETKNFDEDEEILDAGTKESIRKHFKTVPNIT